MHCQKCGAGAIWDEAEEHNMIVGFPDESPYYMGPPNFVCAKCGAQHELVIERGERSYKLSYKLVGSEK